MVLLLAACAPGVGVVPGRPGTGGSLRVSVEPAEPRSGYDGLRCVAEGAAAPSFRWLADGVEVVAGDTVPAESTRLGHAWRCEVTDGRERGSAEVTPRAGGNLLVLLADDVGREKLSTEGVSPGDVFPVTPVLDALADRSVRFVNAWATPLCSPTRATIMTGRMPRQYGLGDVVDVGSRWALPDQEVFLPQVLARAPDPVTSVLVGKWHLNARGVGTAERQPGHAGFAWWRGTNNNLSSAFTQGGGGGYGYWNWERNVDGALSFETRYATEVVVEDAVDALATLEAPWFLYVALHPAHDPFHVPPPGWTHTTPPANPDGFAKAALMIESTDIAVGRILAAMTEEQRATTTVVFLSDNGSMFTVPGEPFGFWTSKGSPYQGGVNVPFWVSGPLVTEPGSTSEALVQTTDLFDTALALAGVLPAEVDALVGGTPRRRFSESFLPFLADPHRPSIRTIAYTEKFTFNGPPPYPIHEFAIRDERFKFVVQDRADGYTEELFDLALDPYEGSDLLAAPLSADAQAAFDGLSASLAALDAELVFEY